MSSTTAAAGPSMSLQQKVQRAGLVAGPLLAVALYWALPTEYRAADENVSRSSATLAEQRWRRWAGWRPGG